MSQKLTAVLLGQVELISSHVLACPRLDALIPKLIEYAARLRLTTTPRSLKVTGLVPPLHDARKQANPLASQRISGPTLANGKRMFW